MPVSDFTKLANSFLTTTGAHIGRYNAIPKKRLLQHCSLKKIGGVIYEKAVIQNSNRLCVLLGVS